MKRNMHAIDRIIRVLFVPAMVILYFTHVIGGTLAIVLGIVAVILALTAFVGFCPVYYFLGINRHKKPSLHKA